MKIGYMKNKVKRNLDFKKKKKCQLIFMCILAIMPNCLTYFWHKYQTTYKNLRTKDFILLKSLLYIVYLK